MRRSLMAGLLAVGMALGATLWALHGVVWAPGDEATQGPAPTPNLLPKEGDGDEDGLIDLVEMMLETNPANYDSDGNGIADGDEDIDGNGIPNRQETWIRQFTTLPVADEEPSSIAGVE